MHSRSATLLERLARLLQNDAHVGGLKPTQWEALRYLSRANRFSRSPGALTGYLGMTKGTVSQTLQALERKGLVKKSSVDGDRRGVRLDLTAAARKLLSDDPLNDLDQAIAAISRDARNALTGSLERLLKDMLAHRDGRPFGACKTCRHFLRKHDGGAPHYCSLLEEPLSRDDSEQICAEQELAVVH